MNLPAEERVLITGCNGFLALHICQQLLHQDRPVQLRGTVRDLANLSKLQPIYDLSVDAKERVELVQADLSSDEGWAEAVKGVTIVLHTASPFFHNAKDPENELYKPAIEGTLRVLRVCAAAGSTVKQVVLTSSTASIRIGHINKPDDYVFTHEDWSDLESTADVPVYDISKTKAELAAWEFISKEHPHKFEFCSMNPGMILGPCLGHPGTSVAVIQKLLEGKIPAIPPVQWSCVDVRDAAAAHICAIGKPASYGGRFILAHSSIWAGELCGALRAEYPLARVPSWNLPWIVAKVGAMCGISDMQYMLKFWGKPARVDGTRITNLGFEYKYSPAVAAVDTAKSLINKKVVREPCETKSAFSTPLGVVVIVYLGATLLVASLPLFTGNASKPLPSNIIRR